MKKMTLALAAIATLQLGACKNSDSAADNSTASTGKPAVAANTSQFVITGKWHQINSVSGHKTADDLPQAEETKITLQDSTYWEFKPDGTTNSNSVSLHHRDGKYTLNGDHLQINMVNVPTEDYTVQKATDKELVVKTGVMGDIYTFEKVQ